MSPQVTTGQIWSARDRRLHLLVTGDAHTVYPVDAARHVNAYLVKPDRDHGRWIPTGDGEARPLLAGWIADNCDLRTCGARWITDRELLHSISAPYYPRPSDSKAPAR